MALTNYLKTLTVHLDVEKRPEAQKARRALRFAGGASTTAQSCDAERRADSRRAAAMRPAKVRGSFPDLKPIRASCAFGICSEEIRK